jgi:hypothetical protein
VTPDDPPIAALLHEAADGVGVPAAPIAAITARGERRRRHRRLARGGSAALAVVGLVGAVAVARARDDGVARPVPAAPSVVAECPARLTPQLIPEWARAGFSEAQPRSPLVLGDRGTIVAIVFGNPLLAPTDPDQHSNKILWVTRDAPAPGPLRIDAVPEDGGPAVERSVPEGPGPSIVDLPAAGCWRLTLTWNGGTDTMRLRYTPP